MYIRYVQIPGVGNFINEVKLKFADLYNKDFKWKKKTITKIAWKVKLGHRTMKISEVQISLVKQNNNIACTFVFL